MKHLQKSLLIVGLIPFVFLGAAPQTSLGQYMYSLPQQTQQEIQQEIDKCIIEVTEYEQKLIELENEYSIVELNRGIYIDSGQMDNETSRPGYIMEYGPKVNIKNRSIARYDYRLDILRHRMDNVKEDIWFAKKWCDLLKWDLELVLKAGEKEREEAFPTGNISTLPSAKEFEKEASKNGKKKIPGKIKTVTPYKSSDKWYNRPYILGDLGAAVIAGGLLIGSGGGGDNTPEQYPDRSFTAMIDFSGLRTNSGCSGKGLPSSWSDHFTIQTSNGQITITQPATGQTSRGPINADGHFKATGPNSVHEGKLNPDGTGDDTHTHIDGSCSAIWSGNITP